MIPPPQAPADGAPPPPSWAALEAVFGALGRVLVVLDEGFLVLWAGRSLDTLACPGASQRVPGTTAESLLGSGRFGPGEGLRAVLERGGRDEGRRAFLQCPERGARLVSVTAAPLPAGALDAGDARARYLLVIRPAEDHDAALHRAVAFQGLVAQSRVMMKVVHLVEALQRSDATVLITGESGTGKEVVARALHAHSLRAQGPLVAVNCGALPGELLESELFGHVRGSFTGAVRDRTGRFELARGGTLFLDEIGDMPLPLQVKLLRVLQERRYERLGESVSRPIDARVIAATRLDLKEAVAQGHFREDLYYRLRVVPIHLPPVRERAEDIEPLTRHLLSRIGTREGRIPVLTPEVMELFRAYRWPGNVRELENALEHAVAVSQDQSVKIEDLPPEIRDAWAAIDPEAAGPPDDEPPAGPGSRVPSVPPPNGALPVGDLEAGKVRAALETHRWSRARAAKALGISRTTLWRKMREFGLA